MARFNLKKEKKAKTTYLPIVLLVLILTFYVLFTNSFSQANLEHEKTILQDALERSITQCYALEGSYPFQLSYLEEHYGLTYNKEHFYIDYQYIGGNLRPDVTIIERD